MGLVTSVGELLEEPFSWTNVAKVGVNVLSMGIKATPLGLTVSLGIGLLDSTGMLDVGFNALFNEKTEMIFRLVFFHFYCYYRRNDMTLGAIPWLTSFCIASSSFSLIITGITQLSIWLFYNFTIPVNQAVLIFVLPFPMFAYMFVYKKKYKQIFNEFRNSKWDTFTFKFLSWTMPVIGLALLTLYKCLLR